MALSRIVRLTYHYHARFLMNPPIKPVFTRPQSSIRFFASDADIKRQFQKSQIIRTSISEPRADELITAIRKGDYKKAEMLVKNGVNVNGHNEGENTPLTDAAQRGDAKAIEFILTVLKANPNASCDCPHHKTGLHYTAEKGHVEATAMLLKHGANPLLLDSRKYTAIDLAKNEKVKETLRNYGGTSGKAIEEDKVKLRMYLPR